MQVSMQACRSFLRATYTNDAPGTEGKPVAVDVRGPVSEVPAIPGSTTIAEPLSTGGRTVTVDAPGPVAEASEAATEHEAGPPVQNAIQMQSNGLRPNPREARWPTRKHARSAQSQNGYALSCSKI